MRSCILIILTLIITREINAQGIEMLGPEYKRSVSAQYGAVFTSLKICTPPDQPMYGKPVLGQGVNLLYTN
ncbi:MAG: hypothetical protein ACHQFW_04725, partial [Chitinophagales bacterium]